VQVVGFDPDQPLRRPLERRRGTVADLKLDDNVFVDELYKQKLGVTQIGDVCEIRGHRARIAGFTRGLRSFTTSPYIFTSFKNAQNYVSLPADQTIFLLITGDGSTGLNELARRLTARVKDVDVVTTAALQRDDALLLDVHDRRRRRCAAGGVLGSWSRRRRRADDLRHDDGSHPRVRNAQGDGEPEHARRPSATAGGSRRRPSRCRARQTSWTIIASE